MKASWDLTISALSMDDLPPILSNVRGFISNSGMTCVIGQNSSGKTILLKALTQRIPNGIQVNGRVAFDGVPIQIQRNSSKSIYNVAYIPADDSGITPHLTVYETLEFAAQFQRYKSGRASALSEAAVRETVCSLMEQFGLTHLRNTRVGTPEKQTLSGGELKRLAVASELLGRPIVLALDEVTSGLDANTAFTMFQNIRSYCSKNNVGVIATLQQPSQALLELFDNCCILFNGGQAYFGPVTLIRSYFESVHLVPPPNCDPLEYYLYELKKTKKTKINYFIKSRAEISNRRTSIQNTNTMEISFDSLNMPVDDDYCMMYEISSLSSNVEVLLSSENNESYNNESFLLYSDLFSQYHQFYWSLKRFLYCALRDRTFYFSLFTSYTLICFLIGALFYNTELDIAASTTNKTFNFLSSIIFLTFTCLNQPTMLTRYFVNKKRIFEHESKNGHISAGIWVTSDWILRLFFILCCIFPGLFIALTMIGFPASTFGFVLLVQWTLFLTTLALVEALVYLTHKEVNAVYISAAIIIIMQIFTGGSFIKWDQMDNWVWLAKLSFGYWASRAVYIKSHNYIQYSCPPTLIENGHCQFLSKSYTCTDYIQNSSSCSVDGREFLLLSRSVGLEESEWLAYAGLVVLSITCFVMASCFRRYPLSTMVYGVKRVLGIVRLTKMLMNFKVSLRIQETKLKYLSYASNMRRITSRDRSSQSMSYPIETNDIALQEDDHINCKSVLSWKNLRLESTNKVLLDDMNGCAYSGKILGVMGGSGAGKSSFLKCLLKLNESNLVRSGAITVNGEPLQRSHVFYCSQFMPRLSYVTVHQLLTLVHRLFHRNKTPTKSSNMIKQLINDILHVFDLVALRDTQFQNLSTSEAKRVAVASSIITEAKVIILDEITTNLDSVTALHMMQLIQAAVRKFHCICILTVHQPSNTLFNYLDDIFIINKGKALFCGARNQLESLIDSTKPQNLSIPEYILMLDVGDFNCFENCSQPHSIDSLEIDIDQVRQFQCSIIGSNIHILTLYLTRIFINDPVLFRIRLVCMIGFAILIGVLFPRIDEQTSNISQFTGAMFAQTTLTFFVGFMACPSFTVFQETFQDQYRNGYYSINEYYFSILLASIPTYIFMSVFFNVVCWFIVGFNDLMEAFVYSCLSTMVELILMDSVNLLSNQIAKSAQMATTVSLSMMGLFTFFSSFLIPRESSPASINWLPFLSPLRYAYRGKIINIFQNRNFQPNAVTGEAILSHTFAIPSDESKYFNLGIVIVIVLAYRLLVVLISYKKEKR